LSLEPLKAGRVNRAVLWHLQLCSRLLVRLGYHLPAAYVSSAIDALASEARSIDEISEMDLEREERVRLVLEMFDEHGKSIGSDLDSSDGGNGLD
jgi:hypothetical protein